jgi:hypothetical protein
MAARSSVTWTHYSVRYKITTGVNRHVRANAGIAGADTGLVRADTLGPSGPVTASMRKQKFFIFLFFSCPHRCEFF